MKESAIGTLALIALLTSTMFLVLTVFSNSRYGSARGFYEVQQGSSVSNEIEQPAFITFFPES